MTTRAPSAANARAQAEPMPPDAPVTTTPLPARPVSTVRSLAAQHGPHARGGDEPGTTRLAAAAAHVVRVEEAAAPELRACVAELAFEAQRDVATVSEAKQMQPNADAVHDQI